MNKKALLYTTLLLIILTILLLIGCTKKFQPPTFSSNQTEFTDQEIINVVCSDYRVPADFYHLSLERDKPKTYDNIFYESTYYSPRPNTQYSEPFCTDDLDEAKGRYQLRRAEKKDYMKLIETTEDEKFFEFREEGIASNDYKEIYRFRVHKCSYLNLSDFVRDHPHWDDEDHDGRWENPDIGTFNLMPVTKQRVKEMSEYLWSIDHYNIAGVKVLTSITTETENEIIQTFYEPISHGLEGRIYTVSLMKRTYKIQKNTGRISIYYQIIDEIKGVNC